VAEAAPRKDFGEEGEEPELASFPEGEAKRVHSEASEPLLTEKVRVELVAEIPAISMILAERV
jgi:hypothetical protein